MAEVKNLSQLKKALAAGSIFEIVEHGIFPEYAGQKRKVNVMQTNGMYTVISDEPNHKLSTCNNGRGSWIEFGKASNWKFENGLSNIPRIPQPLKAVG